MAETTTLTIKLDGTPLAGAEVIFSPDEHLAENEIALTDADGKITVSLPNDYATCILVAVRHSSLLNRTYTTVCVLESGGGL